MIYVTSLVNVCNKALSGLNDFKSQFTAFTLPRVLIAASFLIGIYVYPLTLNLLMLIMFGGFFLNFVLVIYYLNKNDVKFSIKHFSLNDIKFILKISLPLGLTVIFNFLYDKIDVLLISVFKDFTEVAFYNVGYGLYKGSTMAFSFLLVPGFSMVSSLSHSKEDVKQFFNEHFRIILTICIIVSIFLLAGADLIVNIFYTDKFQSSVIVLRILSFGIIAIGLNNLAGIVINSMGYFKVVMYITLYGLVLNFVLNIVFIPRYGMLAASVVTVITEHFVFFTEYYYLKKILRN
jgi:O-antigen/teichoic acid export membrane protein